MGIQQMNLSVSDNMTIKALKQGAAKKRVPGRDLVWGPELGVSKKY